MLNSAGAVSAAFSEYTKNTLFLENERAFNDTSPKTLVPRP